jgi:hypothetical protein
MAGARRCARTANTPAPAPPRPPGLLRDAEPARRPTRTSIASFAMVFHQGPSTHVRSDAGILSGCLSDEQAQLSSATGFVHLAKVRILLKGHLASSSSNGMEAPVTVRAQSANFCSFRRRNVLRLGDRKFQSR